MVIKINGGDPFDPNNWIEDDHEHRIYSVDLNIYVVVDWIDYIWLTQWRWSLHDPKQYERTGAIYLKRVVTEFVMPEGPKYESPFSGKLVRNQHRIQRARFLHQEIMLRTGIPKPTPAHKEVDHINKVTRICKRFNLQWATRSMQVTSSNQGSVRGAARVKSQSRKILLASRSNGPDGRDGSI